jgi:hypothetical protein
MATPDFQVYVSSFSGERVDVFRGDGASGELEPLQTLPLSGKGLAMAKPRSPLPLRRVLCRCRRRQGGALRDLPHRPGQRPTPPVGHGARARLHGPHRDRPHGALPARRLGAHRPDRRQPDRRPRPAAGGAGARHRRPAGHEGEAAGGFGQDVVGAACMGTDHVLQLRFDDRSGHFAANTPAEIYLQSGAGPRHMARQRRCDPCPRQRPGRCRHMDLSKGEAAGTGRTITFSILPGLDASHFVIEGNQLKVGSAGDRLSRGHGASGRGAGHRLPWRLHRADLRHHRPGPGK